MLDGSVAFTGNFRTLVSRGIYFIPSGATKPDKVYVIDAQPPEAYTSALFRQPGMTGVANAGKLRLNVFVSDNKSYLDLDSINIDGLKVVGADSELPVTLVEILTPDNEDYFSSAVVVIDINVPVDAQGKFTGGPYRLDGVITAQDIAKNEMEFAVDFQVSSTTTPWTEPTVTTQAPPPGVEVFAIPSRSPDPTIAPDGTYALAENSSDDTQEVIVLATAKVTTIQWTHDEDESLWLFGMTWLSDGRIIVKSGKGRSFIATARFATLTEITKAPGAGTQWGVASSPSGDLILAASGGNDPKLWRMSAPGAYVPIDMADDLATAQPLERRLLDDGASLSRMDRGVKDAATAIAGGSARLSASVNGEYHLYFTSGEFKHATVRVSGGQVVVSRPTEVTGLGTVERTSGRKVGKMNGGDTFTSDGSFLQYSVQLTGTWEDPVVTLVASVIKPLGLRPVLLLPGIFASLPTTGGYRDWAMNVGVHPSALRLDPLANTYVPLVDTLRNNGYTNRNIIQTPYDWRLPIAPSSEFGIPLDPVSGSSDRVIDGLIAGFDAASLIDGTYESCVDYVGYALERAATMFYEDYGFPLDSVDMVAHSMGGLVARAYIQSDAYGENPGTLPAGASLPRVNEFIDIATPHQGASKAWNILNGNFISDDFYRFFLSGMMLDPFLKLFIKGQHVTLPNGYVITADDVRERALAPQYQQLTTLKAGYLTPEYEPQLALHAAFMDMWAPGAAGLLPVYDFLYALGTPGNLTPMASTVNSLIGINSSNDRGNQFLLDLNAGVGLQYVPFLNTWDLFDAYDESSNTWPFETVQYTDTGDMNRFAGRARSTIVAGAAINTMTLARLLEGPHSDSGLPASEGNGARTIQPAERHNRAPVDGELWFRDLTETDPAGSNDPFRMFSVTGYLGDGTVPGVSAINPFLHDPRVALKLVMDATDPRASHMDLPVNRSVQYTAMRMLGLPVSESSIASGLGLNWTTLVSTGVQFSFDPVEWVIEDADGNRLSYSVTDGLVGAIPNAVVFGGSDGIVFILNNGQPMPDLRLTCTAVDDEPLVYVRSWTGGTLTSSLALNETMQPGESVSFPIIDGVPTDVNLAALASLSRAPSAGASAASQFAFSYVSPDSVWMGAVPAGSGAWNAIELFADRGVGSPISWTGVDGSVYHALPTTEGLLLATVAGSAQSVTNLTTSLPDAVAPASDITVTTSPDGREWLFGVADNGDIVSYVRTAGAWSYWNVSEHLRQNPRDNQSLVPPTFASALVAFSTPWNAVNMAGLDEQGQIWAVWWAPSLATWQVSNLSAETGAPPIRGQLNAFVTFWGAMNLAGLDDAGNLLVTWWVPNRWWETSDLTAQIGGPQLRIGSVTNYLTWWGGMNVVGLDENGHVAAYWWAPGLDTWQVADLTTAADHDVEPLPTLRGLTAPDGEISIVGQQSDGHIIRFRINPGVAGDWWRVEDLSTLTSVS
ncbi:MAG: hypothetical protein IT435_09585 [Phycisphaerales bacterium]|nr:hypothetical protein [Phycisphaerales bacterium]